MVKQPSRSAWLKALVNKVSEGNLASFAERTRMDYTGLNLMVNGKRAISEKTIIKLCSRLSVDPPDGVVGVAVETKSKAHEPIKSEPTITIPISRAEQTIEKLTGSVERLTQLLLEERQGRLRLEEENRQLRAGASHARSKGA